MSAFDFDLVVLAGLDNRIHQGSGGGTIGYVPDYQQRFIYFLNGGAYADAATPGTAFVVAHINHTAGLEIRE